LKAIIVWGAEEVSCGPQKKEGEGEDYLEQEREGEYE